ncbi:hypothetical protein SPRG_03257 [Saprolegnia parasitica CBS 223.65]|uniref:Uncharacterized protein n=1 Tax=Saprolegnia parasitica (strain CBS 223.65) TaxID=695850 RepID=A0A067CS11_SAPPC|nr:hypothetical protein SPRG_03257 [Saprolegnia parasitica CBS 223.65]KDO32040.1 hypothetical protein SPRG_03257 [Saprolegnia parasitica CBS 223.65]|eukprot:XP_012197228.1 hypothetical protein SPRG_03257 [Saprolegnia parasitica CBS 223.65]
MSNTASTLSQRYCEFANVTFPSTVDNGAYRVSVKTNKDQTNAIIWLESKKTKLQWRCAVEDFAKHTETNYALPSVVVLAAIKNGLAAIDGAPAKGPDAAANPSVTPASTLDLGMKKDTLALALEIKISPEWATAYSFEMTSIEVKVVDILEARIRDLEEANTRRRVAFCTVAGTSTGGNAPCTWTTPNVDKSLALLRLDDDAQSVVVVQPGVYTIHCVCQSASASSASISLYIGATCIKTSSFSNQPISNDHDYQPYNYDSFQCCSSHQLDIAHVAHLDAGTHLQLRNSSTAGGAV